MITTLRRVLAAGVGLLCLVSLGVGAYLEDTDPGPRREAPSVVIPRPPPDHDLRHPLHHLVSSVQPGAPTHYRNLTLFPLLAERSGRRGIRTLDDALSRGWITIRERQEARVAELQVRNDSRHTVFLMGGEIITGGKQNRIIRQDVLLGAGLGWVSVPVYCGEKERWDTPRTTFKSAGSLADRRLRESAAQSESQASIWGRIDRRMAEAKVQSPTRDYQQIYEDRATSRELESCLARFRHLCGRRTVGVVAVSHGRIIGCDLFSDPELLSRLWEKICRSYAVDTLGVAWPEHRHVHHRPTARDIRRFLDGVSASRLDPMSTPGVGDTVRVSGGVHGHALSWHGTVVHAALFPGVTILREDRKLPEPRFEGSRGDNLWQSE